MLEMVSTDDNIDFRSPLGSRDLHASAPRSYIVIVHPQQQCGYYLIIFYLFILNATCFELELCK